jgi:hypothetical protein
MIGRIDPIPMFDRLSPVGVGVSGGISAQDQPPKTEKTPPAEEAQRPANTPQEKKEALKESNSAESKELRELQARDQEVRAHEQAHLSAAGQFARSGAQFDFARGADGNLYAIGGEVKIDTAPVANDPQATLEKADIIRRAALAPADPSPTDQRVAAAASNMATEARAELAQLQLHAQQTTQADSENRSLSDNLSQRFVQSGAVDAAADELLLNVFA